ncbi:MAG TPA: cytochrome c oxidase subunit II [Caulobacteraceae bacterium]|jgi:cytochrome c oxidase subunit 2|nr:cytochrome c oxidase subunit II [Caulobacteraceae bacterium]
MKRAGAAVIWAAAAGPLAAAPLQYLTGSGPKTHATVGLTWLLLVISIVVVVAISVLVGVGVWRRRALGASLEASPPSAGPAGLEWLVWGVGISFIALLISLVWTMVVLAEVTPPRRAPLTIEVTGEQWWWRVRYLSQTPALTVTTANEIHIPVGQPVRVRLIGADVIHSFWVPQLTGKTDTIPGQTNVTWLQADAPGVYRGQCTEYCGVQHAHMGFFVIAEPRDQFERWWGAQSLPAAEPVDAAAQAGQQTFVFKCGACHDVRGTLAGGTVAPDLTHLMSRHTIAAATLPTTPAGLGAWISNPQAIKPGTNMPTLYLSGPQLQNVLAYLETLK